MKRELFLGATAWTGLVPSCRKLILWGKCYTSLWSCALNDLGRILKIHIPRTSPPHTHTQNKSEFPGRWVHRRPQRRCVPEEMRVPTPRALRVSAKAVCLFIPYAGSGPAPPSHPWHDWHVVSTRFLRMFVDVTTLGRAPNQHHGLQVVSALTVWTQLHWDSPILLLS